MCKSPNNPECYPQCKCQYVHTGKIQLLPPEITEAAIRDEVKEKYEKLPFWRKATTHLMWDEGFEVALATVGAQITYNVFQCPRCGHTLYQPAYKS